MVWVKIPDDFTEREEVQAIGLEAMATHLAALCYSNHNLTDGRIPETKARTLMASDDPRAVVRRLVEAGWWTETDSGYQLVYLLDLQPSAAKVVEKREATARRVAGLKARTGGVTNSVTSSPENATGNSVTTTASRYPDPGTRTPAPGTPVSDPPSVPPEGGAVGAAPSATDPPAAGGKRSRGRSLGTPAPDDFELTVALVAFAERIGLSLGRLDFETGKFLDHHRARGSTFRDWTAAWRTWMRRAVEYGDSGPAPTPARPRSPGPAPLAPEIEAEPAAVEVWDAVLVELRLGMSQANFESYLAGSVGARMEGGLLTVAVPNPLVREVLEQRFRQHILRALLDVLGSPCRVGFVGGRARPPISETERPLRVVAGGRS